MVGAGLEPANAVAAPAPFDETCRRKFQSRLPSLWSEEAANCDSFACRDDYSWDSLELEWGLRSPVSAGPGARSSARGLTPRPRRIGLKF